MMRTRLRNARVLLIMLLVVSWVVMLALMWRQFWTPPPPELLEQGRMVRPPTLAALGMVVVWSALELAVLTTLLWPGRYYRPRLAMTAVLLVPYFIFTTPLGINSVEQVHRRWLALIAALLLAGVAVSAVMALVRALRR